MRLVEHWVLCIVLDGFELAWHGVAELLLHQVVDERLNHVARNLVNGTVDVFLVLQTLHVSHLFRSVSLQQEASTALLREEVFVETLVSWRENHTHVLFLGHGTVCLICVPSWVESQTELDGVAVRVARWVRTLVVLQRAIVLRVEITLLPNGIHRVAIEQTVASGELSIVEWSREAVHHVAEDIGLSVRAHHLSHVLRRDEHFVETVHISVLAGNVLLQHLAVVDERIVLRTFLSHDDAEVLVSNLLVSHLLSQEVRHHLVRVVERHVDTALRRHTETSPVVEVVRVVVRRQLVAIEVRHGVEHVRSCLTAQAEAWFWSHGARHHFEQVGVVHHGGVEDQLLLTRRELLVAAHSPVVARIEGLEGIVVGDEQSLTTCLCQHIRIVQVVNQTNEIRVVALFLQAVVDARVQIAWVLVVPFVVIRTSHHPTAQRKDAQGLGEGASETRKHRSARPLLYLV